MDNSFVSTRGSALQMDFYQAVLQGIADDGGLLMPASDLPLLDLISLQGLSYEALASRIISTFVPEGTEPLIATACSKAYAGGSFPKEVVPVVKAGDVHIAELFHGPTAAFKDMALQLLPHLLTLSLKQRGENRQALILAATSGDTGKAALEGFADVEGTMIKVFYPDEGVAPIQRQQMVTQQGKNVEVVAIRGNFDDAQRAVKEAFASENLHRTCKKKNLFLTSANSINVGRLVPQIVYYFHAYLQLVAKGVIAQGDDINVAVPSGNFGNCLAGVMAQRMGVPIRRFIVASNRNNVLTGFFTTGCYDVRRPFHKTISPAMDILVSSNLERLLSLLYGDASKVAGCMNNLRDTGRYWIDGELLEQLHDTFAAGWLTDEEIISTIRDYHRTTGYLADTHTAVALGVYDRYRQQTADNTPTVVMATASPYKFPASVCKAVTGRDVPEELATEVLWRTTGCPVPEALQDIMDRPVLHNRVINRNQIVSHIAESIG
ncbi:MAG: threonine synthase [Bacteroidaceae bacterium]|nr:threonine synthase [Bacteroidaceae bacterium]